MVFLREVEKVEHPETLVLCVCVCLCMCLNKILYLRYNLNPDEIYNFICSNSKKIINQIIKIASFHGNLSFSFFFFFFFSLG